ncbi:MAG: hypothetical protein Q9170_006411 [Blastenia crenularia]
MLIAYSDKSGKNLTVSPRIGTGNVEPSEYKSNTMYVEAQNGTGIKDGRYVVNVICHNCRGWSTGEIDFNSTSQPMMYAIGPDDLNLNSNSKSAALRRHDVYGSFKLDLIAARGDPAQFPPTDLSKANVTDHEEHNDHEYSSSVHAVLMAGTFVVLFPTGSKHYNSSHQLLGIVVVVAVLLQATLGIVHHRIFKAKQKPTMMGIIHRFLGPAIVCAGIINGAL